MPADYLRDNNLVRLKPRQGWSADPAAFMVGLKADMEAHGMLWAPWPSRRNGPSASAATPTSWPASTASSCQMCSRWRRTYRLPPCRAPTVDEERAALTLGGRLPRHKEEVANCQRMHAW